MWNAGLLCKLYSTCYTVNLFDIYTVGASVRHRAAALYTLSVFSDPRGNAQRPMPMVRDGPDILTRD